MEHQIITDWAQSMAVVPGGHPSLAPSRRPSLEYGCVDWFDYPQPADMHRHDMRRPDVPEDLLDA